MAWTENGPVSLPPPLVAYAAAFVVVAVAVAGLGLGFRASQRNDRPTAGGDQTLSADGAVAATPIVEIPAMQQQAAAASTAAVNSAADRADETADSNAIAAETAAAQEVQSRPSKSTASIDDVLTSPTEKPQAAAKPSTDEDQPGAPKGKSDVPF